MTSVRDYEVAAQSAVQETAQAFHLEAPTTSEGLVTVPCSYQIVEPGFRPFRSGKASAGELQAELDRTLSQAEERGIDVGIEGEESLRKLLIQQGLGIDCSSFAFRCLVRAHEKLGLEPYTDSVFRSASEIKRLNEKKESWAAKNEDGSPRPLTPKEQRGLAAGNLLPVSWIADVFGKDPEFIIGSAHIASTSAAEVIDPQDALPGDLLAFKKAGSGVVSHVAVIESTEAEGDVTHAKFWHSWHTRDFESGVRRDHVTAIGEHSVWSHNGLTDTSRYQGHFFCRPIGMAALYSSLPAYEAVAA